MYKFNSVSIILPTLNETFSFEETVDIITSECNPVDIKEILAVICDRTLPDSRISIDRSKELAKERGVLLTVLDQWTPFAGGAVRDGMSSASGSHTLMMAPDLETDPHLVKQMIECAKLNPSDITTASRWLNKDSFEGYSKVKLLLNRMFQLMARVFYKTNLTDVTFGYRIAPTDLFQSIDWEEEKHPFFLETALKPLRLGVKFHEIPTIWRCREEGESQNSLMQTFKYCNIAIRARLHSSDNILKGGLKLDDLESQKNS